jgi:hypothetical protein
LEEREKPLIAILGVDVPDAESAGSFDGDIFRPLLSFPFPDPDKCNECVMEVKKRGRVVVEEGNGRGIVESRVWRQLSLDIEFRDLKFWCLTCLRLYALNNRLQKSGQRARDSSIT